VPHDVLDEGRRLLRMADEYESVGDYARTVVKLHRRLLEQGLTYTEEGRKEILDLHAEVAKAMRLVEEAYRDRHPELIAKIHTQSKVIKQKVARYRKNHLERVSDSPMAPLASVLFCDMLHAYQKICAHLVNIAEAYAE
jgi:phosphate:Na+ symporter